MHAQARKREVRALRRRKGGESALHTRIRQEKSGARPPLLPASRVHPRRPLCAFPRLANRFRLPLHPSPPHGVEAPCRREENRRPCFSLREEGLTAHSPPEKIFRPALACKGGAESFFRSKKSRLHKIRSALFHTHKCVFTPS